MTGETIGEMIGEGTADPERSVISLHLSSTPCHSTIAGPALSMGCVYSLPCELRLFEL